MSGALVSCAGDIEVRLIKAFDKVFIGADITVGDERKRLVWNKRADNYWIPKCTKLAECLGCYFVMGFQERHC